MGGRGSKSGIAVPTAPSPTAAMSAPRSFALLDQQQEDAIIQDWQRQYDINTRIAINQYIRENTDASGYTMSQNLNHKMEEGLPLTANEQYVKDHLINAMHEIGTDAVLVRAAHKDFLEALGVKNYQHMSASQLDAAIKGAEYTEKKFISCAMDPKKNPFISGYASGGREVYINIKAPSETKGILGNSKQSEVILAPGTTLRATGAHFDGTYATPRNGGTLPRVVVDVEIIQKKGG